MRKPAVYIILAMVTLLSLQSWSQPTPSPLGRFEVDYIKGCAPLTVTVTNTSGEINDQYFFDADTCDNSSPKFNSSICSTMMPVSTTSFTYSQPGTYSIVQVLTNLVPRTDTLVIEIFDALTPQFQVSLCNNYSVQVTINDTYYHQFQVDYGDGSPMTSSLTHSYAPGFASYPISVSGFFNNGPMNCADSTTTVTPVNNLPDASISQVTVDFSNTVSGQVSLDYSLGPGVDYILEMSVNGVAGFLDVGPVSGSNHMLTGLNTTDNIYCFRIAALDRCSNTRSYSDTICTTNMLATAENSQNQLNWATEIVNFTSFEILKNNAPLGAPITSSNTTSLVDTLVACNLVYCYQAITHYSNGSRSISAQSCVTGINSLPPPAVTSLTASVDNQSMVLTWVVPDSANFPMNSYAVYRSENSNSFVQVGAGSSLPYTDPGLRTQTNRYCYYIIYQDACGNSSPPSVTACAILLKGSNAGNKNFQLNWSPYIGWENGVSEYLLEILDENGVLTGPPISLGPTAASYVDIISNTRQITKYRLVAISNDQTPLRGYSNLVLADIPMQVFVPNSFTPNNDGLNDTFMAKGLFIDKFSMEIYSGWGELLYLSKDLDQGWNGIYRGVPIPEGTYVYQITAIDPQGRTITKKGTVHLLRKFK